MPTYDDWKCAAPGEHPLAKEAERVEALLSALLDSEFSLGAPDRAECELTSVDIVEDSLRCDFVIRVKNVEANRTAVIAAMNMLYSALKGRWLYLEANGK